MRNGGPRDPTTMVMQVFTNLKLVMDDRLLNASWMGNDQSELQKKLNLMSIQTPYEKTYPATDDTSIGNCSLSINYLESSACLQRQFQTQMFSRYSKDPHSYEVLWTHFSTALSTMPVFIYGLNTFLIPLAVISQFHQKDVPKHIKMARLGNLIGRGIAHSFDETGIEFSASGGHNLDLSGDSEATYFNNIKVDKWQNKVEYQYYGDDTNSMYTIPWTLTVNQQVSDITAASLALAATTNHEDSDSLLPWMLHFSSRRVYFLALAQTFCSKSKMIDMYRSLFEDTSLPGFARVVNIVSNSEQFAEEFNCGPDTNMNRFPEIRFRPFPLLEKYEAEIKEEA